MPTHRLKSMTLRCLASSRGQFSLSYSKFPPSSQCFQPHTSVNVFMEETVASGLELWV